MTPRIDPDRTTRRDIDRVAPALVVRAAALSTATLHEAAGKVGALPPAIKPVHRGMRLCGPALTVQSPPGDNLWIHRALYAAKQGDILVVHVGGAHEHGYWGEVMSTAAKAVGLAGLVIDGCVRDSELLAQIGFPVFARGLCIRGTGKDFGALGWINAPILIGDAAIKPGDLILGDADGVVAVSREKAPAALDASFRRDADEAEICRKLAAGATTLDLFGWN